MQDPSLAVQGALVAALTAPGALPVVVGGRVFDRVDADVKFPYVTVGQGIVVPDKAECVPGAESFPEIVCYSDKPGYPEVKEIAAAVIRVLDDNDALSISGHHLVLIELSDLRYRRDADGLVSIADITFRLLTEPA